MARSMKVCIRERQLRMGGETRKMAWILPEGAEKGAE